MVARSRESRKSARRWVRHDAQIILDTHVRVQCVVHDISDGGARLCLPQLTTTLPDTFTLALYDGSVRRECEVVWCESTFVGVRFTSKWHGAAKAERGAAGRADVGAMAPSRAPGAGQERHEH
jgi:PilZ domain